MRRRLWMLPTAAALTACLFLGSGAGASAADFTDVPEGYWAGEEIRLCVDRGFFTGYADGTFAPAAPMERSDFVEVLARFFDWPAASTSVLPYTDVVKSERYAAALAAAYSQGAVTSQTLEFRPHEAITREELAVTLVRALGYQSIAGLSETTPYSDVTKNTGYIAMAYDLGLMNGNKGLFNPTSAATRGQTAVVMARLCLRLQSAAPRRTGLVSSADDLSGQSAVKAVGIQAGRLTGSTPNSVRFSIDRDKAEEIARNARSRGMKALLHVSGSAVKSDIAALLAGEVGKGAYDGLFLQLSELPDAAVMQALREELADKLLYLSVPVYAGTLEQTAAVCKSLLPHTDQLILCAESTGRLVNNFPMDPVDPMDELYRVLRELRGESGNEKLSVMMTTTGRVWTGSRQTGTITEKEIAALTGESGVSAYYSDRYTCAYLRTTENGAEKVVWYLNEKALSERTQFLRLLGVGNVCLSDVGGMTFAAWSALG